MISIQIIDKMSIRNRFVSQLSGVQFNGISTEEAAEIMMQWKQVERRQIKPNADNEMPETREHEFIEIPRKVEYLDTWGKSNESLVDYSRYYRNKFQNFNFFDIMLVNV